MKTTKVLGITAGVLVVVLGGVLLGGGAYIKQEYSRDSYFGRTTINGNDVSGKTADQVMEEIMEICRDRTAVINEKGEESVKGNLAYFGYTVDEDTLRKDLLAAMDRQRSSYFVMIGSLMSGSSYQVSVPYTFNEEIFKAAVNTEALKEERYPSVDSELIYNKKEKEYEITEEVYGNELSDDDLQGLVKKALDDFSAEEITDKLVTIDIPEEFYVLPEVTSDDLELNNIANIYNRYDKAVITYTFGSYTETIDWDTIKDWIIIEDGEGSIDDEKVYEYVENLGIRYNTMHYDRDFHTSIGTDIVIPGSENDYGYLIYQDGEYSQLRADIESNTQVEREPVYYTTASDYGNPVFYARDGKDDLAGNYVEVNLSMQHLWCYRDGGLVVDTDVVTGCVSRNAETKTGVFPIAYKESPSILRGQDAADGYETEVQYWMPFYDGQGLHDASWRGAFGGDIYIYNGSHGCVNMPSYAAEMVYSWMEEGMAVVIYK